MASMARTERVEFAVIGGGLLGLAAARALRRRDRDVVVFEQASVGHRRGGSYGSSRIFRLGYADARYVQLAVAALDEWRELERESGTELLTTTGQFSFGDDLDPLYDAMQRAGAPVEWASAADVAARFGPGGRGERALYEPRSGVLAADACLRTLAGTIGEALRELEAVVALEPDRNEVIVRTALARVRADVAIVCPGPWSTRMLPRVLGSAPAAGVPTHATREHVAYVRTLAPGASITTPVFIAHGAPAVYGLPTPGFGSYKIAFHHAGEVADPAAASLEPDAEAVRALEAATRRWLPEFDPRATLVETCFYDNTPDEHFIVDRVDRVVIGAGTSGHGFKFGPLLGELLADLATGSPARFDLDLFSLRRATGRASLQEADAAQGPDT
jgi:sarcosine oxidase